ncbi:hypothetical protein PV326_001838 [Microctonus aethiopoides]|nr:hypothetical protein PV326_001838 [Microctonus aethiopoides]
MKMSKLIKHHVHTRTVYIHVHHPPKKKKEPKNIRLNNFHEHWSNYKTYKNHNENEIEHSGPVSYPGLLTNNYLHDDELFNHPVPPIPFYDDYRGSDESGEDTPDPTAPSKTNFGYGITGYSYPPQYETHENVDDIPPNNDISSYEQVEYEEGHKAGHEVNTGHLYTDQKNKFYGNEHEESSERYLDESNEENYRHFGDRYVTTSSAGQHNNR